MYQYFGFASVTTAGAAAAAAGNAVAAHLDSLGLGPNHPSVPQNAHHGVVHHAVRPAVVVLHLVKGCQGSPPLVALLESQDEAAIGYRVRLAALGLHLLEQLHRLLPLRACTPQLQ